MKFLSNFDTRLKQRTLNRYQKQYGIDSIVLLSKSGLYGFLKFYLPLFLYLFVSVIILFLFYYILGRDLLIYVGLPLTIFGFLIIILPLLGRFIEFKMDFAVVTPNMLITYDQQGLFKRQIRTINAQNIKTISVERKWFIYSLFNNGDIVFLSEWDMQHGDIKFEYLFKPEKKRYALSKVLWRDYTAYVRRNNK